MLPLATRWPPNHSTAMLDRLRISITAGNMSAIRRPTPSETSKSPSFAAVNRSRSRESRTNARITRTPVICSRSTRLMLSRRVCISRNSGRIRLMIRPTITPSAGTATSSREDSGTSWFRARMMPPTHMIGADTSSVKLISASIWTCCTSFVVRVISDGVPNRPTSRAEYAWTRWKMACRASRPTAIAVLAPKYTAPIAQTICSRLTASMTPPMRMM